ncbi:short-chain dehydrogenase [Neofusicoccum parvum]|nr:short-chain dehydrogenase [Neofusicoccum parvum]
MAGHHQFGYETTSAQAAEALQAEISGKVVVITGISLNGLGAEAARAIFSQNPRLLILASRSQSAIDDVIELIAPGSVNIKPLILDLSRQSSVRKAASELLKLTPVVDVLINNAGVMMTPKYQTTAEGIEWQFGVNHVGHFLFTNLIMEALLRAEGGPRVVSVASSAYEARGVDPENINFDNGKSYDPFAAYAQSKSANALFAVELARRYGNKGLVACSLHPGGWYKDGKPNPQVAKFKSLQQGAATLVVAAFDPSVKDHNGGYFVDCNAVHDVALHAKDPALAEKLWNLSEQLVDQKL